MFKPGYYRPPGAATKVVVYLSPKSPPPLTVPAELREHVSSEAWSYRIPIVERIASRYSKPLFEFLWCIVGLLCVPSTLEPHCFCINVLFDARSGFVVPLALYPLVFSAMATSRGRDFIERQAQARAVAFGISIAIFCVFIIPIVAWKLIGQQEMRRTLRKWGDADRINHGHKDTVPTWTVKQPGLFRNTTMVMVSIPNAGMVSTFHPNASIPAYINGPVDANADYFYPYKPRPGLPRMSTVGNVPLYLDEKQDYYRDTKV